MFFLIMIYCSFWCSCCRCFDSFTTCLRGEEQVGAGASGEVLGQGAQRGWHFFFLICWFLFGFFWVSLGGFGEGEGLQGGFAGCL